MLSQKTLERLQKYNFDLLGAAGTNRPVALALYGTGASQRRQERHRNDSGITSHENSRAVLVEMVQWRWSGPIGQHAAYLEYAAACQCTGRSLSLGSRATAARPEWRPCA